MFSNLVSYLVGSSSEQPAERVEETTIRLTSRASDDDDWVLVDRDSEGNSEAPSEESLSDRLDDLRDVPTSNFGRSSSSSSIPLQSMEESWFITPPPIFTSSGPIQVETSPFENLLIEHPSMSVYQFSHPLFAARRQNVVPDPQESGSFSENIPVLRDTDIQDIAEVPAPRRNRVEALRQEERQSHRNKQAQKIQIQKACQSLKRGYLDRNNKAREVNCRNQRLRRGERSQGATRSYANNNRKC